MKKLMLGAFLMGGMSVVYAQVPQFKDYPVKVYSGPSAKLVMNNEDAKMFKTNFRNALKEKPNFAGEYVISSWGCGGGCESFNFINKKTGRVLISEFLGNENAELVEDYRPNSNLLVTKEDEFDSEMNVISRTTYFYVLKNNKFQLIKKVKTKKPSDE